MFALRRLVALIIVCAPAIALGQERDADEPAAEAAEPATESPATTREEVVDDEDIDDESYLDTEEEDFRPSEEIGADQSIPFPTDI